MSYLVIIGDGLERKPVFRPDRSTLFLPRDWFSASSLFRPRRRFAASAGFLHSEGGREPIASTPCGFGMWHLTQFVAHLDNVPPDSTTAANVPRPAATRPARAPELAIAARLDCQVPERGLVDWQIADQTPALAATPALGATPAMGVAGWRALPSSVATMRFIGPVPTMAAGRPAEAFVRGVDLVVEYGENADGDRCELYYRALDASAFSLSTAAGSSRVYGGVELWVSVQTRQLDSRPHVRIVNRFPKGTQVVTVPGWSEPGLRVFRLPGIQVSYIESVYPADVADSAEPGDAAADADQAISFGTNLNVVWMEKGVIRRCRVRGWWVDRDGDLAWAKDLTHAFLEEAPPLTA